MTIEIVLFVSIVAFVSSIASIGSFGYTLHSHKQRILEMVDKVNYLEIVISYHGLAPLPWELEDLENEHEEIKSFKQEGNIVYLHTED